MLIQNNSVAGRIAPAYNMALENLAKSAQRLATGDKFANAADGQGEMGVAMRMRMTITGTNAVLAGMQNADGYAKTQDEILGHVSDIITRMSELAAGAVDATKTTSDRAALNSEFRSLNTEVTALASNSKYNGTLLFGTATSIRVGTASTDTVSFGSIALGSLTFTTLSLNSVTLASQALISLAGRAASLAVLRNSSRSNASRIERALSFTQAYISNLSNSEGVIRNVDVATETGNFTKRQVLQSAAQSIMAQVNQLSQGAMRFFQ